MSAIITDQFRVLNAETFVKSFVSIGSTDTVAPINYYAFLGQPNHLNPLAYGNVNWGDGPIPLDGIEEENQVKETILSLKRISKDDVRRVVKKVNWVAGNTYEMYRHDYSIYNKTPITSQPGLYDSNFYVVNDNLRVYICLHNGTNPDFPNGKPSFDKPDFIDLEPRPAGSSGDGYIWKYLYTIKPSDLYKFDTIEFIPVPENWGNAGESIGIRENAIDGKIEIISIDDRGSRYEPISKTYTNIPILGDGVDGRATISVDSFGKVSDIFVSDGGSGYTKGIIKFEPGAPGIPSELRNTGTTAKFSVIIPPKGGHGYDIYRELGAYRVLVYTRFIADESNPDVIVDNDFARVGILKNPTVYGSDTEFLNTAEVSAMKSIKLVGLTSQTVYAADSIITQNIGGGKTAVGFVASWNNVTGVLKYYQPVGLATVGVGYKIHNFTSTPEVGGSLTINGATQQNTNLQIDSTFTGVSTVINNRTYQLGSFFNSGLSSPEYNTKSGDVIYMDNRFAIPRSANQKEDIKIVLEF
jgi:hypothetical protein